MGLVQEEYSVPSVDSTKDGSDVVRALRFTNFLLFRIALSFDATNLLWTVKTAYSESEKPKQSDGVMHGGLGECLSSSRYKYRRLVLEQPSPQKIT